MEQKDGGRSNTDRPPRKTVLDQPQQAQQAQQALAQQEPPQQPLALSS